MHSAHLICESKSPLEALGLPACCFGTELGLEPIPLEALSALLMLQPCCCFSRSRLGCKPPPLEPHRLQAAEAVKLTA